MSLPPTYNVHGLHLLDGGGIVGKADTCLLCGIEYEMIPKPPKYEYFPPAFIRALEREHLAPCNPDAWTLMEVMES